MTNLYNNLPLKLALVDDHTLFRKALITLIGLAYPQPVSVVFEAVNGDDLKRKISESELPDIVLMDISMPGTDGFESAAWLRECHPGVKVLVVSMIDKEESIVRMLRLGVKGYLSKDVEPAELAAALSAIVNKGYYYTDFITGKLIHSLNAPAGANRETELEQLNDREIEFLRHSCSDLTYHEIAGKMFLSPKTIDGYRSALFEKLSVKNRVGLALFAVKHGLVKL